jgi:hypothetical protein
MRVGHQATECIDFEGDDLQDGRTESFGQFATQKSQQPKTLVIPSLLPFRRRGVVNGCTQFSNWSCRPYTALAMLSPAIKARILRNQYVPRQNQPHPDLVSRLRLEAAYLAFGQGLKSQKEKI